jgi:hypothetical protein
MGALTRDHENRRAAKSLTRFCDGAMAFRLKVFVRFVR